MRWLEKLLYGKYAAAVRRKHLRSLGLTLFLAVLICIGIGFLIWILNAQNRI